jgi:hypothetical protein
MGFKPLDSSASQKCCTLFNCTTTKQISSFLHVQHISDLDPDPLVRRTDPDPSIIKHKEEEQP